MEKVTRIGVDTSKNVFQLHGVDAEENPVLRKKLTRTKMGTHINVAACAACGTKTHPAWWWRFGCGVFG